jgi:molybdenum cofactor cytidylyltransferase
MIFAVVPAGGTSSRMGRPKLALPLGDKPVLGHVLDALRQAGVAQTVVVIGPHVPELVPIVQAAGAHTLLMSAPTSDMRQTVEHGLCWLEEQYHPRPDDDWLLVPGDYPALNAAVIRQLLMAHARFPLWSIAVPTVGGRRGHPVLLGWQHVPAIRALPPEQGINAFLHQQFGQTLEVPLASTDILIDMDTPEDYARLQQTWERGPQTKETPDKGGVSTEDFLPNAAPREP